MHTSDIGIFGASGYSGMVLTRLLAAHPNVRISFLASERYVGTEIGAFTGVSGPVGQLRYVGFDEAQAAAPSCQIILLATPAEVSLTLAPKLAASGVRVIDLSGGLRLADAELFERYYRHAPPDAALQSQAVYGLPELFRASIPKARVVANPGCYATAAALPLAPLLREGLRVDEDLIVSAASGVSGAGRKASEEYGLMEAGDDFRAYKVLSHQHTPEIAQTLSRVAGRSVSVTFTPHLLPLKRGILSTAYARLARKADSAVLTDVLRRAYANEPFVRVVEKPEQVALNQVVGTNLCLIGVACEPREGGRVVLCSAIDNLVKGAAGQAVQNLNLLLGVDEGTGLTALNRTHP